MNKNQFLFSISREYWSQKVLLVFLCAIVEVVGFLQPVRSVGEAVLHPVLSLSGAVVSLVRTPYFVVTSSFSNYERIADLELRYAEAVAQLSELDNLKKENQELRSVIEMNNASKTVNKTENKTAQQNETPPIVLAEIIAYGQPAIDKGSAEGIQEGNMVMIGETLVGLVGQVSAHQSQILLLSQTNSPGVLLQTEAGVMGISRGDGQHVFLQELPPDAAVKEGERVMTSGQAGIPAGISVGKVQSVAKAQSGETQSAQLDQIVSFYSSHIVEVRVQP